MAAQIVRGVDDGFDAQRAPVCEVLLDPGMLVEGVEGRLGVAGSDLGLGQRGGGEFVAATFVLAGKQQFHGLRAADIEIVGHQRFEKPSSVPWRIEHHGARALHLAHGQVPPIAGIAVVLGQRQRQHAHPPLEEQVDGARAEPVTDGLQAGRIVAGGEPVRQGGEPDSRVGGLTFGPFRAR